MKKGALVCVQSDDEYDGGNETEGDDASSFHSDKAKMRAGLTSSSMDHVDQFAEDGYSDRVPLNTQHLSSQR